jgi:hypothetical protein
MRVGGLDRLEQGAGDAIAMVSATAVTFAINWLRVIPVDLITLSWSRPRTNTVHSNAASSETRSARADLMTRQGGSWHRNGRLATGGK